MVEWLWRLKIVRAEAELFVQFVHGLVEKHDVVSHVEMAVEVDPLRLDPHQ